MSSRLKNIILLFITIIISLVMVEGMLRLFESEEYSLPIRFDKNGFGVHKSNLDKYRFDNESRKKVHIKTNQEGFVGPTYQIKKPDNTLRVALLGDSFTEAMQENYEQTFAVLLEKKIQDFLTTVSTSPYHNVEVMNFGVGGSGTADAMLLYKQYVEKYNPDVVLLNFYAGNDVDDNSRYLDKRDILLGSKDNWLQVKQVNASSQTFDQVKNSLFRSSAIVRLVDKFVRSNSVCNKLAIKVGLYRPAVVSTSTSLTKYQTYYIDPPDDGHAQLIEYSTSLLNNFAHQVALDNKKFAVSFIADGAMLKDDILNTLKQTYPQINLNPPGLIDRLTSTLDRDILIMDSSGMFRDKINQENTMLYINHIGHFNEQGHKVYTDMLLNFLTNNPILWKP